MPAKTPSPCGLTIGSKPSSPIGRQLAVDPHGVSDELFGRLAARLEPDQIVALTAFGGLMVATNLFNNALKVDLDDYLHLVPQGRPVMSTDPAAGRRTTSDLAGQVALITGAAHGQGRASALALAREGVRIAALDVARPMTYPGYPMGSADDLDTWPKSAARWESNA